MTKQPIRRWDANFNRKKDNHHRKKHRLHVANPCPHAPRQLDAETELVGGFHRHHGHKRHNHWRADMRWTEINVDTDGFPLRIKSYDVEMQISGNGEDWFDEIRRSVSAKDDGDPNEKVHLQVHHIHGKLAYRYRVRAVSENCKAEWSDYYVIGVPEDVPAAPVDVSIHRASHGLRLRWHQGADYHDDDLFDERVTHWIAELWTNADFGPVRDFTAAASTDVFTCNSHGFLDGDPVMVARHPVTDLLQPDAGDGLPGGVRAWKVYLVDAKTTNTFKLVRPNTLSAVNLTSDGEGKVYWGLVRKGRHLHKHHHIFRLDTDDFDEDTRFYGRVQAVSNHRSKSAWMPATAPEPNDDPDAIPTGRRPAWHRHVFTFTIIGPVEAGVYKIPNRIDDDYRVRRVTAAFHNAGSGSGSTKIDIKINGSTYVFNEVSAKQPTLTVGDHNSSSRQVVNSTLERGDNIRVKVESVTSTPPANGTIQVVCDRIADGSTSDSAGGGGE